MYIDGKLAMTLRGEGIVPEFLGILEDYVARRYPVARAGRHRLTRTRRHGTRAI